MWLLNRGDRLGRYDCTSTNEIYTGKSTASVTEIIFLRVGRHVLHMLKKIDSYNHIISEVRFGHMKLV